MPTTSNAQKCLGHRSLQIVRRARRAAAAGAGADLFATALGQFALALLFCNVAPRHAPGLSNELPGCGCTSRAPPQTGNRHTCAGHDGSDRSDRRRGQEQHGGHQPHSPEKLPPRRHASCASHAKSSKRGAALLGDAGHVQPQADELDVHLLFRSREIHS